MDINSDMTLLRMRNNIPPGKSIRTPSAKADETEKYNRDLKKATDGFEELFVHKMLQVMRKTVPQDSMTFGGRGEEIFQDMLDENYSKIITRSGAFGLSQVIYEHNKKVPESSHRTNPAPPAEPADLRDGPLGEPRD
ncbi:MAG: rod-binding protein [bacterium]